MTNSLSPWDLAPLPEDPAVSYIMPVLNGADHVEGAIRAILAQDYAGEKEVVVALGPSTDDTDAIVHALAEEDPRVRTVPNPAGDTPSGLNAAVAATSSPVIIRVDAHSELNDDYTRLGIEVLRSLHAANCGGLMEAHGRTPVQKAVARAYMSPFGLGGPAYHSGDAAQESESAYLGVFRREVFEALGGFDETLRRGQDWELNLRIRRAGGSIRFDPRLTVTYWPRADLGSVAQQFYATGVWRAEISKRHSSATSLRYLVPPALVASLVTSAAVGLVQATGVTRSWPAPVRALLAATHVPPAAYTGLVATLAATARGATPAEKAWFAAVLPTMHVSWGTGFLSGLVGSAAEVKDRSRIKRRSRIKKKESTKGKA